MKWREMFEKQNTSREDLIKTYFILIRTFPFSQPPALKWKFWSVTDSANC
jgi:hypothetical protein